MDAVGTRFAAWEQDDEPSRVPTTFEQLEAQAVAPDSAHIGEREPDPGLLSLRVARAFIGVHKLAWGHFAGLPSENQEPAGRTPLSVPAAAHGAQPAAQAPIPGRPEFPPENPTSSDEGRREAALTPEAQEAAAHATRAQGGQVSVRDQARLEHATRAEQAALEAGALQGEIGELEEGVAQTSAQLEQLRVRPQRTPAVERKMRALGATLEDQQERLARKRTYLEELHRRARVGDGEPGHDGWGRVEQARVARLRVQVEMERECERLGKNLRYLEVDESPVDLIEDAWTSSLSQDVQALQHLIRTRVQPGL